MGHLVTSGLEQKGELPGNSASICINNLDDDLVQDRATALPDMLHAPQLPGAANSANFASRSSAFAGSALFSPLALSNQVIHVPTLSTLSSNNLRTVSRNSLVALLGVPALSRLFRRAF